MPKNDRHAIVKGLSVNAIMNMDYDTFNSLNLRDLKTVTSRLVSTANKRIKRMESKGENSPALRAVNRGGNLSVSNKNLNEVRAEFIRAKGFLMNKTSGLVGWKEVRKQTVASLNEIGVTIDLKHLDQLWDLYEKLKEVNPAVAEAPLKYNALRELGKQIMNNENNLDDDALVVKVDGLLKSSYEESMEIENEFEGVSAFFNE